MQGDAQNNPARTNTTAEGIPKQPKKIKTNITNNSNKNKKALAKRITNDFSILYKKIKKKKKNAESDVMILYDCICSL